MVWNQTYAPIGGIFFSTAIAAIPIVVLLGLLGFLHVRAHWAALAGLFAAWVIAVCVFRMPALLATSAAGYGAAFGLFPIGWIVLNAIFVYDITVKTGQFEIVKHSIAVLASDRRIQLLLVAFSFGAFIEGAAGFGTPVAISGTMLIGLGFRPLEAAGLALIGNTAPVAYGALGTPIITLSAVTGLPLEKISAMVGRMLPFFSVMIPFWLVAAMTGLRAMWQVWPACLVTGVSFAVIQFLVSNFHGPWIVDICGSIVSMAALVALLRFWQPRSVWRLPHETNNENSGAAGAVTSEHSRRKVIIAWVPWILLAVFVFVWGIPQYKKILDSLSAVKVTVPYLDKAVYRVPPVVPQPKAEDAVFNFNWLSATGTGLLLSGIISGFFLRLSISQLLRVYANTLWRVRTSLLTIAAMLALGFTSRYSGLDTTMGLAFASTGSLFPFFSPLLGWMGVALTGSDTSSNAMFGNLQQVTAQQIGVSPILTTSANAAGGVMGKMIDAQSIVVASVATGGGASAGDILRYVFLQSLILALLVGVLVYLQAYVFPWMIPAMP